MEFTMILSSLTQAHEQFELPVLGQQERLEEHSVRRRSHSD